MTVSDLRMNRKGPTERVKCFLVALALLTVSAMTPAHAAELLGVKFDPKVVGTVHVALRDASGVQPEFLVDEQSVQLQEGTRRSFQRWQPLVVMVDTSNVTPERLEKIKANIRSLADARFKAETELETERMAGEPAMVVVADQKGDKLEMVKATDLGTKFKDLLAGWSVEETGGKYVPSTVNAFLDRVFGSGLGKKAQPWGILYSSLCVDPKEQAPDLSGFKGPVRILTWDEGLDKKCTKARDGYLKQLKGDIHVAKLDDAGQAAQVAAALKAPDGKDEIVRYSGIAYHGGPLNLTVKVPGNKPGMFGGGEDALPVEWGFQAKLAIQKKTRTGIYVGLGFFVILLIVFAIWRARTSAVEMSKWEAVGEAEEIIEQALDDDAWNATIFQLTGAMPALQDIQAAAQLGPEDSPASTNSGLAPTGDATGNEGPTGMTVSVPVLDDGTAYDAEVPFEVGVLLNSKPVARKTKKFKKVFSIGRATDNRVVIQKDDTVHRYHVVIRPALQGKEWWLEVAPNATNRTNLNGKDLRAGGRYRLPEKFRLQLGEKTELRARLAK